LLFELGETYGSRERCAFRDAKKEAPAERQFYVAHPAKTIVAFWAIWVYILRILGP
jgi:hypothetical protein